jgi:LCP family protein required for cell wall assembly
MVALAVPLLLLVAVGAIVGPIVYRGTRAYQEVFVEPAPRKPVPIAVRNAEGTPVIVMATVASDSTATAEPTESGPPTGEAGGASPVGAKATKAAKPTRTAKPTMVPTPTATPGEIPEWNGTDRLTMLLLGVDRRENEPSRSDTMILVNIDPVAKTANMIAIPRDLRVIIPGYGVHKVNAAYAFGEVDGLKGGGPGLVIQTIETNFGVRIDYFAEVDFAGFVKIVDTLGGVTLDVPYPIKDDAYPASGNNYMRIYFSAGWQHLNGERALQYARTRHDDGDGMRSIRQQQVLLALRQQAVSLDLLTKAGELLGELGDAVRTDLSPTQALQLARLATELSADGITSMTLDPALTEDDRPEGYYLVADWDIVGRILSDFAGTEITPPMSALANPRRDVPIRVENGTANEGLGKRVAAVLREDGFTNVTLVEDAKVASDLDSSVTTDQANVSTAFLIAGLVGIDLDAVALREAKPTAHAPTSGSPAARRAASPSAVGTPRAAAPDSDRDGIVVVLGKNARDPADFTEAPFQDDPMPVGTSKSKAPKAEAEPTADPDE